MNERQYNSKLISDKLSEIPVPANELLWRNIEAQLLAAQPGTAQTPDHTPLQQSAATKAGFMKAAIILLSSAITIVFVIWLIGKMSHPKKSVPARQIPPVHITDSLTTGTLPNRMLAPKKKNLPAVIPAKQPNAGSEREDTAIDYTPLRPLEKHLNLPLTDSVPINTPGTIQTSPDTINLKAPAPQRKDEDYYFDVQKKKKGNKDKG